MNPSPGPWHPTQCGNEIRLVDANDETTDVWIEDTVGAKDNLILVALAPEMRDMLLKLEWSAYDGSAGVGYCPNCKAVEPLELGGGDHDSHCALAALLEKLR